MKKGRRALATAYVASWVVLAAFFAYLPVACITSLKKAPKSSSPDFDRVQVPLARARELVRTNELIGLTTAQLEAKLGKPRYGPLVEQETAVYTYYAGQEYSPLASYEDFDLDVVARNGIVVSASISDS